MTSALQQRVQQVARHARQLVRLYGVGWFVAVVCLAALAVGTIDYLVRIEDFGIRLICLAVLCGIAIWGFVRFVVSAWRYRCSELQAARHIERLYPDLGDRLTSAVAFAAGPAEDELAGSAELRRAVIAETEAVTESLDFEQCFNRRQSVRALLAAGISIAVIVILVLFDGPSVSLAAKRMLIPWGKHAWPRRHLLQWAIAPTRLAVGQDFEVKLADANGQLPEHVEIQYWYEGDAAAQIQTFQMQPLGPHLVHRLANITRPFRYRATGGDDDTMLWAKLTLVEPPRIIEREVTLYPPAYTGFESRRADGSFRALVGTRATLRGRTSKPLSAALLETDTQGGQTSMRLSLDRDQLGFKLGDNATQWTILQSGTYGVRLVDLDGLDVGVPDQWGVDAVRDLPPTVSLKRPAADLMVTPSAQLSLEAIVKDDLAVRSVELYFLRSTSTEPSEEKFTLWTGTTPLVPASSAALDSDSGMQRTVQYLWDLTQASSMKPGEWIDFRVIAVDYKAQVGESVSRRLTFISSEELAERIAQRQSELLAQIAEVVQLQRETRTQTSGLEIQVREAGKLSQNDLDQLQVAELIQRQVQQRLGHPSDGVAAQILALIEEARSNRVDSPDLLTRLTQFYDTLHQLNDDPLVGIQHQLINAVKVVRQCPLDDQGTQRQIDDDSRKELASLFQQVGGGQQRVVDTLEQLLGQLAQWDNYQRLAREVGRLKREQENVYGRTQQLRVETLTEDPSNITAQQRASLKRLTQRQNDVALRFGTLSSGMETAQQKLVNDDPLAAATLADAIDMIRQDGIEGLMRDVGREMDRNRLGQAVDQQETVIELLEQLQDVLANRRQYQLDRKIEQLRDAATQLDQIRARQQAIEREIDAAVAPTPQQFQQWKQAEGDLAEQVQRLARQLHRQGADAADAALTAAGEKLRSAGQAAGAGDRAATQQEARDAQSLLEEARRSIDAALETSEDALSNERITRLRQTVSQFLARQQRLIDETMQAEGGRQAGLEATDVQWRQVVLTLASDQMALSRDVGEVATTLPDIVTFEYALQQSTACMTSAGQRLGLYETGDELAGLQRQAAGYLQQILSAMMEETPRERPDDQQVEQPKPPADDDQQRATAYLLAQLKLIRAMQQQVNQETELLERVDQPWDTAQESRQKELVQQQRRLAEIVQQLLTTGSDTPKPGVVRPPENGLESLDRALQQDERLE